MDKSFDFFRGFIFGTIIILSGCSSETGTVVLEKGEKGKDHQVSGKKQAAVLSQEALDRLVQEIDAVPDTDLVKLNYQDPATTVPYSSPVDSPVKAKATGFFRTEKIDGVWWIIDPKGNGVWLNAVNQFNAAGKGSDPNGRKRFLKDYGGAEKWIKDSLKDVNRFKFTVVTVDNAPYFESPFTTNDLAKAGIAHVRQLSFGYDFWRNNRGAGKDPEEYAFILVGKGRWQTSSDPFHPEWKDWCDRRAKRLCVRYQNDPWLVGWFIDNERAWPLDGEEYLFYMSRKKPVSHAKKAMVEKAKEQFKTIERFNEVFGTKFKTFEDVLNNRTPFTVVSDEGKKFADAMLELTAERYYKPIHDSIRKYAPHHLIIGGRDNRYNPYFAKASRHYLDVVTVNRYLNMDLKNGIGFDTQSFLKEIHDSSGLPMILTEWSLPFVHPDKKTLGDIGYNVLTREEQGKGYQRVHRTLAQMPFMVGTFWFCWGDPAPAKYSVGDTVDPNKSHYGITSYDGKVHEELVPYFAEAHEQAIELHRKADPNYQVPESYDFLNRKLKMPELKEASEMTALGIKGGGVELVQGPDGQLYLHQNNEPLALLGIQLKQNLPQVHWPVARQARILRQGMNDDVVVYEVELKSIAQQKNKTNKDVSEFPFRATVRFWLEKKKGDWCAIELLSVTNTSGKSFYSSQCLIHAMPLIGKNVKKLLKRRPRSHSLIGWENPQTSRTLGYLTLDRGEMRHWLAGNRIIPMVKFERDRAESDVLKPGQTFKFKDTFLTLFSYEPGQTSNLIRAEKRIIEDLRKKL